MTFFEELTNHIDNRINSCRKILVKSLIFGPSQVDHNTTRKKMLEVFGTIHEQKQVLLYEVFTNTKSQDKN